MADRTDGDSGSDSTTDSGEDDPRRADSDAQSADTLRERAGENRLKLWLFFEADRRLVAVAGALIVFVTLVGVGVLTPNVTGHLRSGDPIETAFQAFIGAIITGVTLVVTLNQLVLSQEFGTLDQQRDRFEGTMDARETVADHTDVAVSPSDPSAFLRVIVEAAAADASALRDGLGADTPDHVAEAVSDLVDGVRSNADTVGDQLDGATFGTFDVLSAALDFNYSLKVFDARRIRNEYEDDFSEATLERFDELVITLELFAPAREHIKTLYIQWELIDLSRYVMGSAIPALLVSVSTLLFYSPGTPGGSVLGVPMIVLFVSAAVTVSVTPFLILLSYVLRIASVTKRTLAIGPFTLRNTVDQDE
ncbi:hypothetical protein [Halosimplex salinum]|uniref:hypothetical protein n=1 Tax=Halosimplex salinum TaxID=1710538 RepID=UPI001F2DD5A0|nr:hypothetical protein [Halosimplex salinum]